jgi:hypothetical protein
MAKKQQRLKSKAKSNDDDAVYEEGEEGEWTDEDGNPIEEKDVGIEPQAVPAGALSRGTTVTCANPTPPTNVPVVYQGTPPTQPGLAPAQAPAPDVAAATMWTCADPLNGAVTNVVVGPAYVPAITPTAQLAGRAEAETTEVNAYWPIPGTTTAAQATAAAHGTDGAYSETPNKSHPSYGT